MSGNPRHDRGGWDGSRAVERVGDGRDPTGRAVGFSSTYPDRFGEKVVYIQNLNLC